MEHQPLPQNIHPSWHEHLQPLFDDPKMNMIKNQLLPNCKFYPDRHQIFRVFEMPITAIKVVILGQDPYPNGEGIGLAFAVRTTTSMPPSLKIIRKEIEGSNTLQFFGKYEGITWRSLEHWHRQGVFLLNTALTVEHGNAGSHLGQWQWFTREVIKIISIYQKSIWMLWGAKARGFKDYIDKKVTWGSSEVAIDSSLNDFNYVLEGNHPAAEVYPNSEYRFTGCNHFNLCNEILKIKGQQPIKW